MEIVQFPLSKLDGGSLFYRLRQNDVVTLVCEDDSMELKLDGASLEPHNVNFYTYMCLENEEDVSLNLTCEDGGIRRNLRRSGGANYN